MELKSRNIKENLNLNEKQWKCVEKINGKMLILAGPGTGKTRVILAKYLSYIENDIHPENILCLTFSNKAANEIQKRISEHIQYNNLWIGTFHKIAFKILQRYGQISDKTVIIDELDQKNICQKLGISDFLDQIQCFKDQIDFQKANGFNAALDLYENFLKNHNMLDFGSIISETVKALEDPIFLQKIQEKFTYVLVDEYQDTSKLQNKLIESIAKYNLCCVGDDDQCIYGWRGAYIDNLLKFKDTFADADFFYLDDNYRSTKQILGVANHVINQNKKRLDKKVNTESNGQKVQITCTKFEADQIANEINRLPENETIAILFRQSHFVKQIEMSLTRKHINYKVFAGVKFFNRLEIKTALCYLKAVFLEDILSIEHILSVPKKKVGPKKIEKILQQMEYGLSFLSALNEIGLKDLSEMISEWRNLDKQANTNPVSIMKTIWDQSGCKELFVEREDNFILLLDKLSEYKTIGDFLQNFFTVDDEDESRVSLMTIHRSKGLEFDNVFIPFMVEGVIPGNKSIASGNLDEERRVIFVAMTRAKKRLFLSYNVNQYVGKTNFFGPSRFIFNISNDLIHYNII